MTPVVQEASAGVGFYCTAIAASSRHNWKNPKRAVLGIRWVKAFSVLIFVLLGNGNRRGYVPREWRLIGRIPLARRWAARIREPGRAAAGYEVSAQATMLSPPGMGTA